AAGRGRGPLQQGASAVVGERGGDDRRGTDRSARGAPDGRLSGAAGRVPRARRGAAHAVGADRHRLRRAAAVRLRAAGARRRRRGRAQGAAGREHRGRAPMPRKAKRAGGSACRSRPATWGWWCWIGTANDRIFERLGKARAGRWPLSPGTATTSDRRRV
ncbi:MAG: hypothetical protein AVDCRST_MAG39-505, partial [uncultured Sphingomonadaceae bacterium]